MYIAGQGLIPHPIEFSAALSLASSASLNFGIFLLPKRRAWRFATAQYSRPKRILTANMGAIKRKDPPSSGAKFTKKPKTTETKKPVKAAQLDHFPEPDSSDEDEDMGGVSIEDTSKPPQRQAPAHSNGDSKEFKLDGSSAEAHAKQRTLAKERKAAKPNSDIIARSKKIWERLRRKSHVPKEERKELVNELFTIINGRVRDFVFKHDSVRVIQCALKYANMEQRKNIMKELQGDLRSLAESRYGKFLVAKMVVEGDQETRDMIVPEFYGHVRRLINHPEASWIVDDIYRQVASREQKNAMLREWYGAEFALFHRKPDAKDPLAAGTEETAELAKILEANPEKRRPILQYLHQLINSLIQKKMTGFTMLHDAMLQYFLALPAGSEEQRAFLDEMLGDIDAETEGGGGDLYKNLAFTKNGSRLVCLALAHGTAKDRKLLLRVFSKETVDMMAFDTNAKNVLVAGLEVPDDTTMTTKVIYRELLGEKIDDKEERLNKIESVLADLNARLPLLFPIAGPAKWLITKDSDKALMEEVFEVRKTSSKKAPEIRRKGLIDYMSKPLLELIAERTSNLVQTTTGCQFLSEALLELSGDKEAAKNAIAALATGDPTAEDHIASQAAAGRMLKTLVLGGVFDPATKSVKLAEPRLGFAATLWPVIKSHVLAWACSASSFVVVALTESEDVDADVKKEVMAALKKGKKQLEAAGGSKPEKTKGKKKDAAAADKPKGNAGARMLLEKI
jgi:pumilio family protein 6